MKRTWLVLCITMMLCSSGIVLAQENGQSPPIPLLPPANGDIGVNSGTVTMEEETVKFRKTPLVMAIPALAERYGVKYTINGSLTGSITGEYSGMRFEAILNDMSKACNFTWIESDGRYIISLPDVMKLTKTFKIRYLDKDDLKKKLGTFISSESIAVGSDDNTITITTNNLNMANAEKYIEKYDRPTKQITLQVSLVEVSSDDQSLIGFTHSWEGTQYNPRAPWRPQFTTTFDANRVFTTGKVLARPTVTTQNGLKAEINMIDKFPVFTTTMATDGSKQTTVSYEDIGFKGVITPTINETDEEGGKDSITVNIDQTVSTLVAVKTFSNASAPQVAKRQAKTVVRVQNGETIIIGGLLKEEDRRNVTGIPGLMDLPLLGSLFKVTDRQKIRTEVFMFITPVINDGTVEALLYNNAKGKYIKK